MKPYPVALDEAWAISLDESEAAPSLFTISDTKRSLNPGCVWSTTSNAF